ncbi:thioredoxin family protein [Nonomuraea sp. NPDC051941]|uniref:thioredoxin family protein n=1 Tax=Nonomuraea sp. NPDC051941 TaxID=3364373 RepID=UPI0037C9772B
MHYIISTDDLTSLVTHNLSVIVCCYSDWCPASSQSKPVFERVAAKLIDSAAFAKVRTDVSPEVSEILQVTAIPSFYAFTSGTLVGVLRGSVREGDLIEWICSSIPTNSLHALAPLQSGADRRISPGSGLSA